MGPAQREIKPLPCWTELLRVGGAPVLAFLEVDASFRRREMVSTAEEKAGRHSAKWVSGQCFFSPVQE